MARIKFGIGVADIRGSLAGTTFSSGTYGAYMRRKAVPTNTKTTIQTERRAEFASLSAKWRGLTDSERETWISQAPAYTRANSFGDNVPLTGQALFMRCNLNLLQVSAPQISVAIPPVSMTAVDAGGMTIDNTATDVVFDSVGATSATTAVIAYATDVFSNGVKYVPKSKYRIVDIVPISTASADLDFSAGWQSQFGRTLSVSIVGSKVQGYLRTISITNGQSIDSPLYSTVIV